MISLLLLVNYLLETLQGGDYNRYPEHSRNSQYPSQQQGHVQGQGQGQGQGNAQSLRNAAASHQPDGM